MNSFKHSLIKIINKKMMAMKNSDMKYAAFAFCLVSWIFCVAFGQSSHDPSLPLRAANLGGWLVAEGWMTPSLFHDIPKSQFLDGTQVQLRSTKLNKYLTSEGGGGDGSAIVANRDTASGWETFRLWRIDSSIFNFRVFNKQFIGLKDNSPNVIAASTQAGAAETFTILWQQDPATDQNGPFRVRIRAPNGSYLQANGPSSVTADYGDGGSLDWDDQNPSVFEMKIVSRMQGEYQLTNGYGPDMASQILKQHWENFIVENDFREMSEKGLNAVRIPVGWWIKYDQEPASMPKPFVSGSLKALDNAFTWAQKYNMKVIVDLHAVPGSQNPDDHSGSRDGYLEWGDSHIDETVSVIDFLAQRYGTHPSLIAIELMNEPRAPDVTFSSLSKYYQAAYDTVRKHAPNAYVILSNRLAGNANNKEFLNLGRSLSRSVIDVHYYNLFDPRYNNMNLEDNINIIKNDRRAQLQEVTQSGAGAMLSFVGEWSAAMDNSQASQDDYQRYGEAQVEVYEMATFGWAYWAYKLEYDSPWSLQWMLRNKLINF